jgi:hypothetical protein
VPYEDVGIVAYLGHACEVVVLDIGDRRVFCDVGHILECRLALEQER